MIAGRELDALIAEKVMGWKLFVDNKREVCAWDTGTSPGGFIDERNFKPSRDIAAAWQVVEKLDNRFILDRTLGQYRVRFTAQDSFEVTAESAPHAICLAALKAVGVKLD